ncbi:hypothetical protein [Mesorhizobium sp. KR1-2]|uniref:hypothetical protein n=1 Tax=Mesorhizobium sp. KR1-2 TaxID=3156609 RepID=UPI0032B39E7A
MEGEYDLFGEDANVVCEYDIQVFEGAAVFSRLKYPGIDCEISRLHIFNYPEIEYSYDLFGKFTFTDAIDIALILPQATADFDGLRCSVTEASSLDLQEYRRNFGRRAAILHLFRVEDAGQSNLDVGAIYSAWGFGLVPTTSAYADQAEFPESVSFVARSGTQDMASNPVH